MGVPESLLGRQVRCPNCKQVVVAPATAPEMQSNPPPAPGIQIISPPAVPQPPVPTPSAPPAPEPDLPVFNIPQRKEGADSILGEPEESEDEVFGTHKSGQLNPLPRFDLPASIPAPADTLITAPVSPPPVEPPNPLPEPIPTPTPTELPETPANPFTDFESQAATPPEPKPAPSEELEPIERPQSRKKRPRDEESDEEVPTRPTRGQAPAKAGGVSPILLVLVAGYALVATAVAVYGLFFHSGGRPDEAHPLSTIPDNFGEFDPATRKKVTRYKFPVNGELPPGQRAKLGETLALDGLEIKPLKIVKRRLTVVTEGKDEKRTDSPGTALVLHIDIKNTSADLSLYPMDPAFTRKASAGDDPITRIVVDRKVMFAGGAIQWPFGDRVKRRLEVQQQNDYLPLRPGESREYVVFTDVRPEVVRTVEGTKGEMEWRVQVRRGPIEYRGREVPVTAIIGVEFTAADVH